MKVFDEFYERGTLSKEMNATFIVLVPKKETRDFTDFRSKKHIQSGLGVFWWVLKKKRVWE